MKCLVCKKEYPGGECPRCGFPEVNVMGNYEEGLKTFEPVVKAHRRRFMESISLGIVTYRWKDVDGTIVLDCEEKVPFGPVAELVNQERWIDRKLARIPEESEIRVTCYISYGGEESNISVSLPNLLQAELQQVGIYVTEDAKFSILLKNEAGACTRSREMELFL